MERRITDYVIYFILIFMACVLYMQHVQIMGNEATIDRLMTADKQLIQANCELVNSDIKLANLFMKERCTHTWDDWDELGVDERNGE